MKKNLILLTDSYPIASGEFFIDDEMQIISNRFEKIIVIVPDQEKSSANRKSPKNIYIQTYSLHLKTLDFFKAFFYIFTKMFREELTIAIKQYKIKPSAMLFKLMLMDIAKAIKVKTAIQSAITHYKINDNNAIFYSYWHDYKALALALIRSKNEKLTCIARAHRWDIYFHVHEFPYLPFKKYIINSLTKTYSISTDGKTEFEKLLKQNLNNKIEISRLGKTNNRPIASKIKEGFLFCTCSNLIPVKRIHLIIDILSRLKLNNMKWVHFGDGYLKQELENYANEKIPANDFSFKGLVDNEEILNYYSQNYVDLFLNVSESEGIPVSIMEALSSGIPVLATDVGGTSEILNNEIGFLIQQNFQVADVAELIQKYVCSPIENQEKYREKAYTFWKNNYNAENNYTDFADRITKNHMI